MDEYQNGGILLDSKAFDEDFLLDDTEVREEQVKKMWFCLSPFKRGKVPLNCWLYGEPGTGKSAIARFVMNQLLSVAHIGGVCVNCWEKNTFYGILDKIITELKILGPEKPAISQKLDLLRRYLRDNHLLVILDDIDRPSPGERNNIIYNLCSLSGQGLILISRSRATIFDLEERIKSRLNAVRIEFPKYTREELINILERRAEKALAEDSWDRETLERIAGLAGGDSRVAIQTLRDAAFYAQGEGDQKINGSHVMRSWSEIREANSSHLLSRLTEHHAMLYHIVKEAKRILSNDLWKAYQEECVECQKQPISTRTFPIYVNELRDANLVKISRAPVKGRVREITIA